MMSMAVAGKKTGRVWIVVVGCGLVLFVAGLIMTFMASKVIRKGQIKSDREWLVKQARLVVLIMPRMSQQARPEHLEDSDFFGSCSLDEENRMLESRCKKIQLRNDRWGRSLYYSGKGAEFTLGSSGKNGKRGDSDDDWVNVKVVRMVSGFPDVVVYKASWGESGKLQQY